jgi:hypothetical protein
MARQKIIIGSLAACAIAMGIALLGELWTEPDAPEHGTASAPPAARVARQLDQNLVATTNHASTGNAKPLAARRPEASPSELAAERNSGPDGIAVAFFDSDNYLDFVNMHLANAQAGDASSQYYVGRALEECGTWLDTRSSSASGTTLGEKLESDLPALQKALLVQQHYRCAAFADVDMSTYGSAEKWLRASAGSDYGPALSYAALDHLLLSGDRNLTEGKRLLRGALASGHAEATWHLSFVYGSDVLEDGEDGRGMAARLLACQQGYVCDERNLTFRLECAAGRWDCRQGDLVAAMQSTYPAHIGQSIAGHDWQALQLD